MDRILAQDIVDLLVVELERRQGVNLEDDLPLNDLDDLKDSWVNIICAKAGEPKAPPPPPH